MPSLLSRARVQAKLQEKLHAMQQQEVVVPKLLKEFKLANRAINDAELQAASLVAEVSGRDRIAARLFPPWHLLAHACPP